MSVGAVGRAAGGMGDALARVTAGLDDLLDASAWSLSDEELRAALVEADRQEARLAAAKAALLRESVSREAPDTRGERGARTRMVLERRCRIAPRRARADVANAVATDPHDGPLRGLGEAWAEGTVSREHVDVARRCLHRLPARIVRERRDEVDALLTAHARDWAPTTAETLAQHLLHAVAPDRADRYDENAFERRHVSVVTDSTGMVLITGQLDAAGGQKVDAVLDRIVETDRHTARESGDPDLRTRGQLRADAFVTMAVLAAEQLAAGGDGTTMRSVPRVVVVTTPEQLARGDADAGQAITTGGTVLTDGTLQRLACDAVHERVVLSCGRVVSMTSLGRLATPAQRAALAARDKGCTWPGCTAPPSLCEAHHVVWWSRGGPTTIDNLALLCTRHHTQVHAQPDVPGTGWVMLVREGRPWFRPPDRHTQPPDTLVRNTFHDTVDATRRPGTSWRPIDPDPP